MPQKKSAVDINKLNQTKKSYPLDTPIHVFLENQAAKTPTHVAVSFEEESYTYEELNKRTNQIARYLQSLGVSQETLVGVYMERSIEMVVAIHGIVKSGGAYVPIDPEYPNERVSFMAKDAGIQILLTQTKLASHFPGEVEQLICLDKKTDLLKIDAFATDNLTAVATPDSLAYMIYTSGSTGQPKGVPNIHKALVNRLLWQQDAFGITEQDVVLQKTPYSFDVSVWEFFWPFMFGAKLVMAKPGGHKDATYLLRIIREQNVTTIHFVPSMLSLFLSAEKVSEATSLHRVICSGEALPMELTHRFFDNLPKTELHNLYGPTEAAIDVTHWPCQKGSQDKTVPIGFPIANTQLYILDEELNPVPMGESGELHIGGVGLARGYWKREQLTQERFVANPFSLDKRDRLYKTGDLAKYRPDGSIEFLGRIDFQVKIRGLRIELQEIESVLISHTSISEAAVIATDGDFSDKQLVAFVVCAGSVRPTVDQLRKFLLSSLPDYMVPARFVFIEQMPLSPNGKIDRKALDFNQQERPEMSVMYVAPKTKLEKDICQIWCDVLQLDKVGVNDNFFELGGNSLLVVSTASHISEHIGFPIPIVKLFQHPTVATLVQEIQADNTNEQKVLDDAYERATRQRIGRFSNDPNMDGIAIIGIEGRFPGAETVDELWKNLCDKKESITRFPLEEIGPGIAESIVNDPNYVPCRGIIEDADKFDAPFFGIGPLEAQVMDPQQRVFLQLAWAALEKAGYAADKFSGPIGVFAGVGDNHYYHNNVLCHPAIVQTVGRIIVGYGNEKDYIATRVSYALNLTGPSISANTGCSTSLLAVDGAFRSLMDHECDMALAGGVDIFVPQKSGQLYMEGATFTRDGHCRPFDAEATGTMFCDGAGMVVLRRLEDAIRDGDHIYAVIKGTARNNDGSNKVSFLAPSVDGQYRVITQAQAQANIEPDDIGYVEAHGTGTPLGDPIEIEALTKAFRARTQRNQFCYIGSVKGNIGHPTIASGVAGLIKSALVLHHELIPATLHYKNPNPKINFESSPFKVVQDNTPWPRSDTPRISCVSSFGFGGTNVHAIVQEAPQTEAPGPSRPLQILRFSAKNEDALDRQRIQLAKFFKEHPDTNIADAAFTLDNGRVHHAFRQYVLCTDTQSAAAVLANKLKPTKALETLNPDVVFMFPGQGAQYVNMGISLYHQEPIFKKWLDRCCDIASKHLDRDLRELLFPKSDDTQTAYNALKNTYYTQPAIFCIEYSLAKLWIHWGIQPSVMIGHSIGEFVCACLSDVFNLEDAIRLIVTRGQLMRNLPKGSMLSIRCAAKEIESALPENIQLAASNGPKLCVVAGPDDAIEGFSRIVEKEGKTTTLLHTSHAFHSAMMDSIVEPFQKEVSEATRNKPKIPFVSTCTGQWITDTEATSSEYWAKHLRMPVRFSEAVDVLVSDKEKVFLEVGPRNVLSVLARQHIDNAYRHRVVSSLGSSPDNNEEWLALLGAIGDLWKNGIEIHRGTYYANEKRRRISLPTYPFEKRSYWLEPSGYAHSAQEESPSSIHQAISLPTDTAKTMGDGTGEDTASNDIAANLLKLMVTISGLDASDLAIDVPFLELGLDSLLLTQFAAQIFAAYDCRVSLRQLSRELSTVELLAEHLKDYTKDTSQISEDKSTSHAIDTSGKNELDETAVPAFSECPVTEAQHEIWLSCKISTEASAAYNESFTMKLTGAFDIEVFQKAVRIVVERHDALRMTFSTDGKTCRIQNQPQQISIPFTDLSQSTNAQEEYNKIVQEMAQTPYDLENGPLFKTPIVRFSDNEVMCILAAHHIICDGWSLDVVIRELAEAYTALKSNQVPRFPVAKQFAKHSEEQKSIEKSNEFKKSIQFWKKRYASPAPILELPTDHTRPVNRTYNASRVTVEISPDIYSELKTSSAQSHRSIFSMLLSGLYLLLHRLSSKEDIVVGIPVAGQPMMDARDLVGHCVSFLPVRVDVLKTHAINDFLDYVQDEMMDSFEHHQCTYGRLLSEIPFVRQSGYAPLVSVLLTNSSAYKEGELRFADLNMTYTLNPRAFETFDLYFNTREDNGRLEISCHFNTNIFTGASVTRYLQLYEEILRLISRPSTAKIGELAPITRAGQDLLDSLNRTEAKYPSTKRINELFEKIVSKNKTKNAVHFNNTAISYAELNHRANQLAHHLRSLESAGKPIGICLPREIDMVVGVVAILKAGGAYVPLDPSFPKDRLAYMVEDSGLTTIVVNNETADIIKQDSLQYVNLTSDIDVIKKQKGTNFVSKEQDVHDLAYIIYTSGSTGKPKGIELEHKSVVNFLTSMAKTPGLTSQDKVLAITTLSFDISVLEILLPLTIGAEIILLNKEQSLDDRAISGALEQHDITVMQATPATWRLLTMGKWTGKQNLKALCGGEAISSELASSLLDRVGELWNMYGPTETTVWSTCKQLKKGDASIAIGAPINNTSIYILDSALQRVPVGVPGELYIGGEGLARGYHNRKELTSEQFISNPFVNDGTRMYRTGDLAKVTTDGELICLGRTDFQVKLRGFRIELGEIENVLQNHPTVQECAVIVHERSEGDQRLVAYIRPDTNQTLDSNVLKTFLRDELPDYMVPSLFQRVETFPLTGSGKIDRKSLPEPIFDEQTTLSSVEKPKDETERTILQIWSETLGVGQIGLRDNFFDTGGNSLLVIDIVSKIEKIFNTSFSMTEFFKYPTIAEQAVHLSNSKTDAEEEDITKRAQLRARQRQAARNRQIRLKR
ncbi:MAG: amino acid adenylation domain-containing protein [Deltaproteobacteria bacterium]|nr:amino acid adenylation domain-containing protein [Deltaproteobacteria bacterium]